jgi:hypothetical protein
MPGKINEKQNPAFYNIFFFYFDFVLKAMPTLAVLLIVIDGVPFADVWRRWADTRVGFRMRVRLVCVHANTCIPCVRAQAPPGWAVRFLIHAKDRRAVLEDHTQPAWVHASLLPVSFRPEWGSIELVRAALELVHVALEDASVQWLALASESCVPVVPLDTVRARCAWVIIPCVWRFALVVLVRAARARQSRRLRARGAAGCTTTFRARGTTASATSRSTSVAASCRQKPSASQTSGSV